MANENPISEVDQTSVSLFHMAASMLSRVAKGEHFPAEEIEAMATRLQDHAADLQLAASRLETPTGC